MTRTLAAVLLIWAGLLIGVSFVATPAKFLAPGLPIAQALDVGRWTFHVLAWIEWGFVLIATLLIAATWRSDLRRVRHVAGLIAIVAGVLAVESFALRPMLDDRVLRIIAGERVPSSQMHNLYIALEAARLTLIGAAGVLAIRCIEGRPS